MKNKPLTIELYYFEDNDGLLNVSVKVNDVDVITEIADAGYIIHKILNHLGYNAEVVQNIDVVSNKIENPFKD